MGSAHVRLLFVLYALLVGYLFFGRFDAATTAGLTAVGLRSAVGVLLWLAGGLAGAFLYLWRHQRALKKRRRTRPGGGEGQARRPGDGGDADAAAGEGQRAGR